MQPKQNSKMNKNMKNQKVILYPSIGAGHLIPMVELAKLFVRHDIAVTIAIPSPPQTTTGGTTAAASSNDSITRIIAANPTVSFHLLPPVTNPNPNPHPFLLMLDSISLASPHLLAYLRSLPSSPAALVVDGFCVGALDVATELDIPAYIYYTSAASVLTVGIQLPIVHSVTDSSFKDMGNTILHLRGVTATVRACDMPDILQDRESDLYKRRNENYPRMLGAKGILINSFQWLEAKAAGALKDGVCVPGSVMPPVYFIGPLVAEGKREGRERHECLDWLDSQPEQSVVFLCFGSLGAFSARQLKEMAHGLENSGQRFLWLVRCLPENQKFQSFSTQNELDLDVLLPEGFLERTKDRGMVVKSWVPQAEVLRHSATGAFVTHCGWNSTLEAVVAGVPMVCWPLYAEQRLNKVFMVEEMKIGVEMEGYDEELVKAEEVEVKVRSVMLSEEGKKLRERLAMAKEMAAEAAKDGGSSQMAFVDFLKDWEN